MPWTCQHTAHPSRQQPTPQQHETVLGPGHFRRSETAWRVVTHVVGNVVGNVEAQAAA